MMVRSSNAFLCLIKTGPMVNKQMYKTETNASWNGESPMKK